jgi:hypothetical protein
MNKIIKNNITFHYAKIKMKCDFCKKIIHVMRCHYLKNKYHFCNRKCCDNWRSKNINGPKHPNYKEKIEVHCNNCNIKINIYPYKVKRDEHHFCNIKCYAMWKSKNIIGDEHPNYVKRIRIKCTGCGKYLFLTKKSVNVSKLRFCCNECKYNFQASKKSWTYIHGQGNKPYPLTFNGNYKDYIRKRDKYHCQRLGCKMTQKKHLKLYGQKLPIHHIDYNKNQVEERRLITLCRKCNGEVNANTDYWFAYFSYILKRLYEKKGEKNGYLFSRYDNRG